MTAISRARIGLSVPAQLPPAGIPAYARRAESAGFDELWLAEDCFFAGVRGPRSLELSGRIADGTILAWPLTSPYIAKDTISCQLIAAVTGRCP